MSSDLIGSDVLLAPTHLCAHRMVATNQKDDEPNGPKGTCQWAVMTQSRPQVEPDLCPNGVANAMEKTGHLC